MLQTPYEILNIDPTKDKMAIRRAYVREMKKHHPDHGGDPHQFRLIQDAYDDLINNRYKEDVIVTEVSLPLINFMVGCTATIKLQRGPYKDMVFEFEVPPITYPGTSVEFYDRNSTRRKIRVKLHEQITNAYTRLDSSVIIRRQINTSEATKGHTLNIENFDGTTHTVTISPNTTADRLIFHIAGSGFYERDKTERGNLTIIVEVNNEGN